MQVIDDLLGQNVATTTARYMHLQPEVLRRAMETLHAPTHDSNMAVKNTEYSQVIVGP